MPFAVEGAVFGREGGLSIVEGLADPLGRQAFAEAVAVLRIHVGEIVVRQEPRRVLAAEVKGAVGGDQPVGGVVFKHKVARGLERKAVAGLVGPALVVEPFELGGFFRDLLLEQGIALLGEALGEELALPLVAVGRRVVQVQHGEISVPQAADPRKPGVEVRDDAVLPAALLPRADGAEGEEEIVGELPGAVILADDGKMPAPLLGLRAEHPHGVAEAEAELPLAGADPGDLLVKRPDDPGIIAGLQVVVPDAAHEFGGARLQIVHRISSLPGKRPDRGPDKTAVIILPYLYKKGQSL